MLNKSKIRLMARLAIYDKNFGVADRRKNNYYKWDYVYFRNFWTRLGVFFGCLILSLFYVLNKLLIEQVDVFTLDFKQEATKLVFFTVLALVLYTVIGTLVANAEYKKSRARLDAYFSMLALLEGDGGRPELENEPENEPDYGGGRGLPGAEDYGDFEWESELDGQEAEFEPPRPPKARPAFKPRRSDGGAEGDEKGIDILKRFKGVKGDERGAGASDLRESGDDYDV